MEEPGINVFQNDLKRLEVNEFIESLVTIGEVIFFGGYARNKLLNSNEEARDIDVVVNLKKGESLEEFFSINKKKFQKDKNRYGGFKLTFDKVKIDIWELKNTCGLRQRDELSWVNLLDTVYSNIDEVAFNYTTEKWKYDDVFNEISDENREYITICRKAENNPDKELILTKILVNTSKYGKNVKFDKYIKQDYLELKKAKRLNVLYERQKSRYKKDYFTLEMLERIVKEIEEQKDIINLK